MGKIWISKSPAGVGIDWSNPLAKGLLWAGPESSTGREIVSNDPVLLRNTAAIGPFVGGEIGGGLGLVGSAVNSDARWMGASVKSLQKLNGTQTYSIVTFVRVETEYVSGYETFWQVSRNPRGTPYLKIGINRSAATDKAYVGHWSEGSSWSMNDISASGFLPAHGSPPYNIAIGAALDANSIRFFNEQGFHSEDSSPNADVIGIEDDDFAQMFHEMPDASSQNSRWAGRHSFTLVWDRKLSDQEMESAIANPWQIFKPKTRFALSPVSEDVRFSVGKKVRTKQPPLGTLIDWSHPLARELVFFTPLNEPGGDAIDIVTGTHGVATTSGTSSISRAVDQYGRFVDMEMGNTSDNNGFAFPSENIWEIADKKITILSHCKREDEIHGSGSRVISKRSIDFTTGYELLYRDSLQVRFAIGGSPDSTVATANNAGVDAFLAGTYDGADVRVHYRPGFDAAVASGSEARTTNILADAATPMSVGQHDSNERSFDGIIYWTAVFHRILSDDEIASFWDNPWQIFQPELIHVPFNEDLPDLATFEKSVTSMPLRSP